MEPPLELFHQHTHQNKSERRCLHSRWPSHAIVGDVQKASMAIASNANLNRPLPSVGKCVFQGVGHELVQDKRHGDSALDVNAERIDLHNEAHLARIDVIESPEGAREILREHTNINLPKVR